MWSGPDNQTNAYKPTAPVGEGNTSYVNEYMHACGYMPYIFHMPQFDSKN